MELELLAELHQFVNGFGVQGPPQPALIQTEGGDADDDDGEAVSQQLPEVRLGVDAPKRRDAA